MKVFSHEEQHVSVDATGMKIWRCESCRGFHMRVGGIVLTFTHEEYVMFLHAAGACYLGEDCAEFLPDAKLQTRSSQIGNAGGSAEVVSLSA